MTFFYRHMPKIIEDGYLYIAQPPLYKVKKGSGEVYIKNETVFSEYIINNALTDSSLEYGGGKTLAGGELSDFMKKTNIVATLLGNLSRYINSDILEALAFADAFNLKIFDDMKILRQKAVAVVQRLNNLKKEVDINWQYNIDYTTELRLIKSHRGVNTEFTVGPVILGKPEALELAKCCGVVYEKVGGDEVKFIKKDENFSAQTPLELMNIINQVGQKGISIQRFKGLGEMNAEQLWETTLNPQNRTLLKVSIDDAALADETFATLMGSVVEPRRDFIQDNALRVVNLDI
jgi:DNA gyrase subunit B